MKHICCQFTQDVWNFWIHKLFSSVNVAYIFNFTVSSTIIMAKERKETLILNIQGHSTVDKS